jgi:hypothetical protein
MRNRSVGFLAAVVVMAVARGAVALPDDDHIQILAQRIECPLRSGICVRSGAPSTLAEASLPTASLATDASTPVFARRANTTQWTLTLDANLRRTSWKGNALFLIYDADDHEAVANHEVTALYQAPIGSGRSVGARLILDADEGIRVGHTYLIRIVQLINNAEVLLAETRVELR